MPQMIRLETIRGGLFIDNVTPMKDDPYSSPLLAPLAEGHSISKTRYYTVGTPDPRYQEPDWDPSRPTIEYRADMQIEDAELKRFTSRISNSTGGKENPHSFESKLISPSRSVGINTPTNYFGNRSSPSPNTSRRENVPFTPYTNADGTSTASLPAVTAMPAARTDSNAFGSSSSERDDWRKRQQDTKPPSPSQLPRKQSPPTSPKAILTERPEDSPKVAVRVGLDLDSEDLGGPSLPPPSLADNYGISSPPSRVKPSTASSPGQQSPAPVIDSRQPSPPLEVTSSQKEDRLPTRQPASDYGDGSPVPTKLQQSPQKTVAIDGKDLLSSTPDARRPLINDDSPPTAPADTLVDTPVESPARLPPSTPPPTVPEQDNNSAFQSHGAMAVAKSPLDISSVLEYYREACGAFNATQSRADHIRCRLGTDADIDRLRMTLSAALSCSRALQQLSLSLAHHPTASSLFRLEEGKDVITDATFEKLVDLQASELNVIVQALGSQQQLLRGRTLAEDGLLDYQRGDDAFEGSVSGASRPDLETLAASLSHEASEAYIALQKLYPTAVASEMSLSILCGSFDSIVSELNEQGAANSGVPEVAKQYLGAASASGPPAVDIPKLRSLLRQLATEFEQLSAQRGVAMSDAPNLNASASGPSMRRAQQSALKYFVPSPPRTAFGGYFSNARKVVGIPAGTPAPLDALKVYIKALDQARKSVIDPLELVVASTKSTLPPSFGDDGNQSAGDDTVRRVKQQAAAASIFHASEVSGKRIVPQLRSLPSMALVKEMLLPAARWLIQTGGVIATNDPASPLLNAANAMSSLSSPLLPTPPAFSPQGLKELFLLDLCTSAAQYKKTFRKVCEMETLLLSFEDVTDAYVAACHSIGKPFTGGPMSRSSSQSLSRSPNGTPPNRIQTEQALKAFVADLTDSNADFKTQVDQNISYLSLRKRVFDMLAKELRFLKKLDQVPLYFPPEYVLLTTPMIASNVAAQQTRPAPADEAALASKLKVLKAVARANSTVAQACLRTLANSMVTITKPDEDPAARIKAEHDNARRVPLFLMAVVEMQQAEEALSDALLKCRRFLTRGGPVAGRPTSRVLGAHNAPSATVVDGARVLFGGTAAIELQAPTKEPSTDAIRLFGPKSAPVSALQAELFRRNLKGLIEGGVLVYLGQTDPIAKTKTFIRFAITFHPTSLDRLLLIPKERVGGQPIPVPFTMVEMVTRGAKVADPTIGDLQTMRFHFDKKVMKTCAERGPQQFEFANNTNPPQRVTEGGSVASVIPLINKNSVLEVFFPGSAAFQQWSDTFQLLLDNKAFLGPEMAAHLGL